MQDSILCSKRCCYYHGDNFKFLMNKKYVNCTVQFSYITWQLVILSVWNINSWLVQITTKLNINWKQCFTPFVFVVRLNLEWIFKLVSSMKWEFVCLFLSNETFWCEVTSNICFQLKVEQIDFVITVVSVYLVHLNQNCV